MSDLKIKGAVKLINEVKVISDKFSVREFVVTIPNDKYPQDVIFQTVNDKMDVLDLIKKGQEVEVSFNLRGREYAAPGQPVRYYNTLDAWRIEILGKPTTAPFNEPIQMDDDLPF